MTATARDNDATPIRSERPQARVAKLMTPGEAYKKFVLSKDALEALRAGLPTTPSLTFGADETASTKQVMPPTGTPPAFAARLTALTPRPPNVRAMLIRAAAGIQAGHVDSAFDNLFEEIDELVFQNDVPSLERLLSAACAIQKLPLKLLVGVLTITLPLSRRLEKRAELVRVTRALAERIGGPAKATAVLSGLE